MATNSKTRSATSGYRKTSSTRKPAKRTSRTTDRSAGSQVTSDHDTIRRWTEERGGSPACVIGTGDAGDEGMLRIDFPDYSGERSLRHISWDDWFEKFDCAHLALLYQETTKDGQKNNFNKLVDRGEENSGGRRSSHGRD